MRLFVIGPINEDRTLDLTQYNMAVEMLEQAGHTVTLPYNLDKRESTVSEIMLTTTHMLATAKLGRIRHGEWCLQPYYDGVVLVGSWEVNYQAKLLKSVAEACGLECKPMREYINLRQNVIV